MAVKLEKPCVTNLTNLSAREFAWFLIKFSFFLSIHVLARTYGFLIFHYLFNLFGCNAASYCYLTGCSYVISLYLSCILSQMVFFEMDIAS